METNSFLDILTSEQSLRNSGRGTANIVLQPSDSTRATRPYTIRIVASKQQPSMSAYAWELGKVVALKLTQHYGPTLPGYSDCEATIAHINSALSSFTNQLASTTVGILISGDHQHSSLVLPRKIQHIKAHPD